MSHCHHDKLNACVPTHLDDDTAESDGLGHAPTMAEKIENDDPSWGDEWHEKHQVAERREMMLEGAV